MKRLEYKIDRDPDGVFTYAVFKKEKWFFGTTRWFRYFRTDAKDSAMTWIELDMNKEKLRQELPIYKEFTI